MLHTHDTGLYHVSVDFDAIPAINFLPNPSKIIYMNNPFTLLIFTLLIIKITLPEEGYRSIDRIIKRKIRPKWSWLTLLNSRKSSGREKRRERKELCSLERYQKEKGSMEGECFNTSRRELSINKFKWSLLHIKGVWI